MKLFLLTLCVALAAASPIPDDSVDPVEVVVNGVPEGEPVDIGHIVDLKLNEHIDGELASASDLLHPYTAVGIAEAAAVAAAAEIAENEVSAPEAIVLPEPATPEVAPEGIVLPAPATPEVIPEGVSLPEPATPEVVPEAVVLPEPATPEVIPEAVALPEPATPEVVPEGVVLPAPATPEVVPEVTPEAVVLPEPATPEVIPEGIVLPEAATPEVVPEGIVLPAPVTPEVVPEVVEIIPGLPDISPAIVPEIIAQPEENPSAPTPIGEIINDGLVSVTVNVPEDDSYINALSSWFSLVLNYFSNGLQYTQQIV